MYDLLLKYHGIKVSEFENLSNKEVSLLVQRELAASRPVILEHSGYIHSEKRQHGPLFILVVGINDLKSTLFYLYNKVDVITARRHEVERMPIQDLKNWCGSCTTFRIVQREGLEIDWLEIITSAHRRLNGSNNAENAFTSMRRFADEVRASLDIRSEVEGYPNQFWVPLFYNIMRIGHGRVQFARLLQYLARRYHIKALSKIAEDLEKTAIEWSLIRTLFIKSSLKPDDKPLVDRISTRIHELSLKEEKLANALLYVSMKQCTQKNNC